MISKYFPGENLHLCVHSPCPIIGLEGLFWSVNTIRISAIVASFQFEAGVLQQSLKNALHFFFLSPGSSTFEPTRDENNAQLENGSSFSARRQQQIIPQTNQQNWPLPTTATPANYYPYWANENYAENDDNYWCQCEECLKYDESMGYNEYDGDQGDDVCNDEFCSCRNGRFDDKIRPPVANNYAYFNRLENTTMARADVGASGDYNKPRYRYLAARKRGVGGRKRGTMQRSSAYKRFAKKSRSLSSTSSDTAAFKVGVDWTG